MKKDNLKIILIVICAILLPVLTQAENFSGSAFSENAGWINFNSTHSSATASDAGVIGYIWSENIGWIHLDYDGTAGATNTTSTNYGVVNDGSGNLSGYAWSENAGWINFHPTNSQVIIDNSGNLSGYAWSENIGWIKFNHTQTSNIPATTWTPASTETPATVISAGGNAMQNFSSSNVKNNQLEIQRLLKIIEDLKAQIQATISKQTLLGQSSEGLVNFQFIRTLKFGDTDIEVKLLQEKLKELNFFPEQTVTTNYFGSITQKAVQDFQIQNNITKPNIYGYGIVGPKTRAILNLIK